MKTPSDNPVINAIDWGQKAFDTATEILTYLGIGTEASGDPGIDRRRDHICRLVEIALATQKTAWQPIETAPQNEMLLLCDITWPHHTILGKPVPIKVGYFWEGRWNISGASWSPTHWQPLPNGPSVKDTEEILQ